MAFKPIDPKRDEYRRYLERGGIIESLTKVFVRILKDRPEDPTQYLLQNLGDARLQADNITYLQNELDDARLEVQRLTEIIRSINPDLLKESNGKEISKTDVPLIENVNSNEVHEKNYPVANQTDFMQREEYTPIGGVDESVKAENNVIRGGTNEA